MFSQLICRIRVGHLALASTLLVAAVWAVPIVAVSGDPAFVGVLALAVDDEGTRRLGLSEEVREQLARLIARRENEAVSLALSVKDLPPEEQTRRLAPFVAESERMGFELLTQEQRSILSQLRLRRAGMLSLADAELAQLLELTAEQRQAVGRLVAERTKAMTQGGELQRRLTRDRYERQLRSVLTPAQRTTWDQMAGITAGPAGEQPVADAEQPATDVAASAAPPTDSSTSAQAAAAPRETVVEQPAAGEATDAQPGTAAADGVAAAPGMVESSGEPAVESVTSDQLAETPPRDARGTSDPAPATPPVRSAATDLLMAEEPRDVKLRFSFRFQPWEDVLDWLAEQADLSLQSSIIPEGTFNYSDPRAFTPSEAIDLINGVLLTQGYTLVRRGRLLTVMNLEDEVPDVLVEFVPLEKLDERGEYELVKTVFHLAKMEPSDAQQEIGQLLGPGRNMIVMPKARQILVTETAGKLRTIRDVIERVENPRGLNGTSVSEIKLAHLTPEEILLIARPLLGLEGNQNVGEEISIAIHPLGSSLFATGNRQKIEILQDLVTRVDKARDVVATGVVLEQPQLLTHPIQVADPAGALDVMRTLLAGMPDVRLELDKKTNKIIALARPSEHRTIQETIKQLEGESPQFEVIPLKKLDPQLAVLTINNFLGTSGDGSSEIKIDADPLSMKLYVRATRTQLDQIRALLEKLEGTAEGFGARGNMRLIPLTGSNAVSAVEMAERLWRGPNRIQMTVPSDSESSIFDLREIAPERPEGAPKTQARPQPKPPADGASRSGGEQPAPSPPNAPPAGDRVTGHAAPEPPAGNSPFRLAAFIEEPDDPADLEPMGEDSTADTSDELPLPVELQQAIAAAQQSAGAGVPGSDIRIEFTQGGILISSDDTEALDRFEEILRMVAGPQSLVPEKNFTVFFL